jgi:adhesin/invasin
LAKFGIAALAIVVALVAGFGALSSTRPAEAAPTATQAVWCGFLAGLDVNGDDAITAADGAAACDGLSAAEIVNISEANSGVAGDADGLGDEDGVLESGELDDVDLDANQITDGGAGVLNQILIFAFVNNDGTVTFDADTGVTVAVHDSGGGFSADADANPETCAGADDEDCDDAVPDDGDGVVVATVIDGTADAGDEVDVDVVQDSTSLTETLSVVGTGDDITLTLVETTIQTDADTGEDCTDDDDLAVTDSGALSNPDSTIAIVVATDNDGTALTRESVTISSDDDDIATIGDTTVVTVDGGDSGVAFFAVICGQDDTGTATISVTGAGEDADAELTVVGPAANVALTASPSQIACDGSQTSTVSATVTDADGNNVANGTTVTFSVVALGTANPINTTTTDGTASSTITPLSGATAGVTVIVTSGDASASIRVDCSLPIPTVAPPGASPTPPGGVRPPDTGNGGYLGQDSAGFPLWTLVALALGSFALVAGGMVTRRVGR